MTNLIMLVGISYSGKSTIAKEIKEEYINRGEQIKICSSDEMRERIFGNASIQDNPTLVFEKLHKEIRENLSNGISVIYDATNLSSKRRISFLKSIAYIKNIVKKCVIVMTPIEECIERIKIRDRVVPKEVIFRQLKNFSCPYYFEGWDEITIYSHKRYNLEDFLNNSHFSQDNPHHSLYCDEHMKKAYELSLYKNCKDYVKLACRYHDLGKFYTKSYLTKDGNISEYAHYYSHHNVSAYLILLGDKPKEILLKISVLCNLHMEFFFRNEKGMQKLKELIGEELYKDLEILHECDIEAH